MLKYLVQAVGVLLLVAVGLRLAAWLITPFVPSLVVLFILSFVLFGLLFPELLRRR